MLCLILCTMCLILYIVAASLWNFILLLAIIESLPQRWVARRLPIQAGGSALLNWAVFAQPTNGRDSGASASTVFIPMMAGKSCGHHYAHRTSRSLLTNRTSQGSCLLRLAVWGRASIMVTVAQPRADSEGNRACDSVLAAMRPTPARESASVACLL